MSNELGVLGANGFIGRAIFSEFVRESKETVGIDIVPDSDYGIHGTDIRDHSRVLDLLDNTEILVNASGSLKPKHFMFDFKEAMDSFWLYLRDIEEIIVKSKIKKYVNISSAGTVYGESKSVAGNTEDDYLEPNTWYGKVKVLEEQVLENVCRKANVDYICFRISNPFGNTRAVSHGFVDVLLNKINSEDSFVGKFHEDTCRDFIYIQDMAKIINRLLDNDISGVYNIATGTSVRLLDIIEFVQSKAKTNNIIYENRIDSTAIIRSQICVDKTKSVLKSITSTSVFDYLEARLNKLNP